MALRCLCRLKPLVLHLRLTTSLRPQKSDLAVKLQTHSIAIISRHLATKKNKEVKQEMKSILENLKEDFTKNLSIRTTSGAFDHITVTTKDEDAIAAKGVRKVDFKISMLMGVTREHRENLTKLAKQLSNKAKDSLRKVRTGAVQEVKKCKEGVSEDIVKLLEKQNVVLNPKAEGLCIKKRSTEACGYCTYLNAVQNKWSIATCIQIHK
ncbi:hypothetical protein XELAEV_18041862mg [Xenopus laevis]|uniref:Ribosome-recycling factor, mitochondrial n=1 Tax=Xenopus laevis TaxID=8355 RepID=A0A974C2X2_XENLA|nr:hypothetical protein XELAEV_18041862mg [Xenopus laevis]